MEVAYSCESLVLPLSETHFFTIHIISIPSDVFIVHTQQFICNFCRYRTFSIIQLFYKSCEYHFLLIPRIKTPGLLQHFVAPIAYAPHLCYTTPTSNFGHDIFIMFQLPMEIPSQDFISEFHCFFSKEFTQIFDDVTHSPQL